jgi:hypothetical protein
MWQGSLPVVNYLFVFLAIIKQAELKKNAFVGVAMFSRILLIYCFMLVLFSKNLNSLLYTDV